MFDHSTEIRREIPVYTSVKERLGGIPFLIVRSTYNTYKESKAPGGSNPFNGYATFRFLTPARQHIGKLLQGCPFMEVLAMHSIEQFLDIIITKRKIEREGKIIRKGNGGFTGLFLARKNLPGNWISG